MFQVGIGNGFGENKAVKATFLAFEAPWNFMDMSDATRFAVHIKGDITLSDVSDATDYIRHRAGDDAVRASGYGAFVSKRHLPADIRAFYEA